MLIKRHRFHGYNSLRPVYQKGRSFREGPISLKYSLRSSTKPYRVAVVVSKKVSKSAVVRNRIRRRIYEAVRIQRGNIQPGTDMVLTVYDQIAADIEYNELIKILEDLIKKIRQN